MRLHLLVLTSAMLAVGGPRANQDTEAGARVRPAPGLREIVAAAQAGENPPVLASRFTTTPPQLDGFVDEVWHSASPSSVTVRKAIGGQNPRQVTLRALHTQDSIYILAQWPDATRSDLRDPYVWNPEKGDYERPSKPDDQFAIQFPLQGEFDLNMLNLKHSFVTDVWHWKAGRGNPVGWVDDKRHVISQQPVAGAVRYSMGGHGDVYIARPLDEGTASYALKPKPQSFQGEVVDSFEHHEPTGSLADVRGKGFHDGQRWTLEMSRKFDTGHADDAVLDPGREIPCAIAVLDDELYWEHFISQKILLRFAPGALPRAVGRTSNTPSGRRWNFEDSSAGSLPTDVDATRGQWTVQEIADAPAGAKALVQVAHSPRPYFNLAVIKGETARDLRLSVRLKALSGSVDQGGGLVWRCRDADNYYIARINPLENNFRAYRVLKGTREMLGSADVTVEAGKWHTLRVTMRGNRIECELNGRKLLEVSDDMFKQAGRLGVWTKADANTAFDILALERLDAAAR